MTKEQLKKSMDDPVIRDPTVAADVIPMMLSLPLSELGNAKIRYNNGKTQHETIIDKLKETFKFSEEEDDFIKVLTAANNYRYKERYSYGTALLYLSRLFEGYEEKTVPR
ncbi:MAG: hypothetical protein IJ561_08645 [Ruminococcus sp.]|nr:hypothetical protein [Ruminococcus sp.]